MPIKDPDRRRAYEHARNQSEKRKARSKEYYQKHRAARIAYASEWYQKNRERADGYKRKYQMRNRLAELVLKAGRPRPLVCDICGHPSPTRKALHFDHCHQTGHFRGWICCFCNSALGYARDDPNILRKMVAYLERNLTNTSPQLTLSGL